MHLLPLVIKILLISMAMGYKHQRIAIIGAGIGGSATAYFLKQLFAKNASITIYEKEVMGGRIATLNVAGDYYESGAAVIHPRNKYINDFSQNLGLKPRTPQESLWGIYNGEKFVFQDSEWSLVTLAHLYWRYGWDIFRLNSVVSSLLDEFDRIYEAQDQGLAFTTVHELLSYMSPRMANMTRHTLAEFMKYNGFSDIFINELVQAISLVNYGQNNGLNAFAGTVSLAGSESGLWSVQGGNNQIPISLLGVTDARIVSGEVLRVTLSNGTFLITYLQNPPRDEIVEEYDIVVVATPLTTESKNVKFVNFPKDFTKFERVYHRTVSTFVYGKLNPSAFQSAAVPDAILTNNDSLMFNSIGLTFPVSGSERRTRNRIYKVFSKLPLSEEQIKFIFSDVRAVKFKDWLAYPRYTPPENIPPYILYPGVYYVNPIESAASAMEMSTISAKNVALLIFNKWLEKKKSIDPLSSLFKDEL